MGFNKLDTLRRANQCGMFDARLDDQVKLSGEFRRFRDASYTQLDAYLELFNGEGRPMISAAKTGVTTATYIRLP